MREVESKQIWQLPLQNFSVTYPELINIKDKVLINNSTERSYDECYDSIAKKYGFTIQNFNNIGICGARQWVAEDFEKSDKKYYIFFEDDMLFNTEATTCKNGFIRKITNLYNKSLQITKENEFDFLK